MFKKVLNDARFMDFLHITDFDGGGSAVHYFAKVCLSQPQLHKAVMNDCYSV